MIFICIVNATDYEKKGGFMVEFLALWPSLVLGAMTGGIIIGWIPNLLFRGGKEPPLKVDGIALEPDEQSKLSKFLEWIVFICLFPFGLLGCLFVSSKVFEFLTDSTVY